jgi:hypothetical protein
MLGHASNALITRAEETHVRERYERRADLVREWKTWNMRWLGLIPCRPFLYLPQRQEPKDPRITYTKSGGMQSRVMQMGVRALPEDWPTIVRM